jgi:DNA topoisomerase-3
MAKVLMVAEKPSIAKALAGALCRDPTNRQGRASPVYSFQSDFQGRRADFIVTAVCGHIFSHDFPAKYNSWEKVDPVMLFDAETVKLEQKQRGGSIIRHLQELAHDCDVLVLWLDCDREGENICFEVIEVVSKHLRRGAEIWRAKFSSLVPEDLRKAMQRLGRPNINESLSVDARGIIDLKVGCAFSRFQTRYLQEQLRTSELISYGPCQTPTLWFVVQAHEAIEKFVPEQRFHLRIVISSSPPAKAGHSHGAFKSEAAMKTVFNRVKDYTSATVLGVERSAHKVQRPQGLNTVQMLKLASSHLGLGPHHAMGIAESLYLAGYMTYPRTESTAYPANFNHLELLGRLRGGLIGEIAGNLIGGQFKAPRKGVDTGDHPPITPVRAASHSELSDTEWAVYEMITRSYLASVSPNAKYFRLIVTFTVHDDQFTLDGSVTTDVGFGRAAPWALARDKEIPEFRAGETVRIAGMECDTSYTSPPPNISESDLLGQMEHHGIGTDASMASHIQHICDRKYVNVDTSSRRLIPTKLGIALVNIYLAIDSDLVTPTVRSSIEGRVAQIARGEAQYAEVVNSTLAIFKQKFQHFAANISRFDDVFAPSRPVVEARVLSKCGVCFRYMKLLVPPGLKCETCDKTYKLPHNAILKARPDVQCPLDRFELVLITLPTYSSPVCPKCFTDPPFEDVGEAMSCLSCPNYECMHSSAKLEVASCNKCQEGSFVLNGYKKPEWLLQCGVCLIAFKVFAKAKKVDVLKANCTKCDAKLVMVEYKESPWPTPQYSGCLFCDPALSQLCEFENTTSRPFSARRRGGRRGRRGGRRGGRQRGRR